MGYKKVLTDANGDPLILAERSTFKVPGRFMDETGAIIPVSALSSLTLTLYVKGNPAKIINSRNKQNVLNINGVTADEDGNFAWVMAPLDNAVMGNQEVEVHVALFEWVYSGSRENRIEIEISVANMEYVPTPTP